MRDQRREECVIWKDSGVVLQTYDREGQMHLSDLGRISLTSIQDFCQARKIRLYVRRENARATVDFRATLSPIAREEYDARGR